MPGCRYTTPWDTIEGYEFHIRQQAIKKMRSTRDGATSATWVRLTR